jgi:hypothetical protein
VAKRGISRAQAEQLIAEAVAAGRMTPVGSVGVNVGAFGPAPAAAPASPAKRKRRKPVELVAAGFASSARRAAWTVPLKLDRTTNDGALKKWLIGVAGKHRREVGRALAARLMKLAWFRKVIDDGGALLCTITRIGGGVMDDDNLPPCAKWVRDTVALFLGQDDGPAGPIIWKYAQEPGGAWGVRITLEKA